MKRTLALSALLAVLAPTAFAQTVTPVPSLMNFQGRLAKPNGTPVTDGFYTVTFRIYDAQTGGNLLWKEQSPSVYARNGTFATLLGNITQLTDSIFNGTVWLELQVNTDAPLSPRQRITSVAYAFKANTVPDGAITTAKIADGAITAAKLAPSIFPLTPGISILTTNSVPPTGFSYTGRYITAPQINSWSPRASMPTARDGFGTAVVNGKIYAIGGDVNYLSVLGVNEMYDPQTDTWVLKAPMPTPRWGVSVATVNGKIYAIGGQTVLTANLTFYNTLEEYDPAADTWKTKAPMPIGVSGSAVAVVNNKIYCIGGSSADAVYRDINQVYDPSTDTWTQQASAPTSKGSASAVAVNGKIYVIGGTPYDRTQGVNEVYDPTTDTWATKTPLPTYIETAGGFAVGNSIYIIGGTTLTGVVPTVYKYNVSIDKWQPLASMTTARRGLGVAVIDNVAYAIGGGAATTPALVLDTNEEFILPTFPVVRYYIHTKN